MTIDSFLLIGQSNMAGRGLLGQVPAIEGDNLWMLRNGRWQPLREPIHTDRHFAGIGLAASFAKGYAAQTGHAVGLIPCADGGTSLCDWAVGGQLFDHAVLQTRLAQRISTLQGILWHQGEGDCDSIQTAMDYEPALRAILTTLRQTLDAQDVPLVLGELGEYLPTSGRGSYNQTVPLVNSALARLAASLPRCAIVSSSGLTSNDDLLHFNAPSLRTFGERYLKAYMEIIG